MEIPGKYVFLLFVVIIIINYYYYKQSTCIYMIPYPFS